MRAAAFLLMLAACAPEPAPPTPPATPAAPVTARAASPRAVDARIDFEEGDDPDFGENTKSVRAFLVVQALGIRKKLFAVPYPYTCGRGEAGADLMIQCKSEDGSADATVRIEPATIVVIARDYGRLELQRTHDEIPLPPGATATVFAPARYPGR